MKDTFMNAMLKVSAKIQSQKYMVAIKNGFTKTLPIIIIGSFCTLISNVVCSTTEGAVSLANIPGMDWLSELSPIFTAGNYATMNLLSLIIVMFIALELAANYKTKDKVMCAIISLGSYITLCATTAVAVVGEESVTIADVLSKSYTGVQGLFLAMIVGILASELYLKLENTGKFKIHMPDSVPSNVAEAFNVIMPGAITILVVSSIGTLFQMMTDVTVFDAVSAVIQRPLQGLLTGLPGYLFIMFMTTVLWFFGIHGTQVLKPVYSAAMLAAIAENADYAAMGQAAPNILNESFRSSFSTLTGAGITGGLIIAILLFSKKEDWRAIAKLAIPCAIFNINEPLLFGLPIVLNPILMIPFMVTPLVSGLFAYFMTEIGFAAVMTLYVPWTTPPIVSGFLNTQGHIGTALTQVICIGFAFLIYTPFVIMANKMKDKQQLEQTEE